MTYFNEFGQARLGWNVGTPSSGGGSTVDTDAQAFITAANITDSTQQSAINTLVTQLKTYGIWTKLKAVYPFVGGTASSHKFNLKDPRDLDAAYRLVFNGGWIHSSTGALPNGTTAYADTKLIPSSAISNQSSAHLSFYSNTNSFPTVNGTIKANGGYSAPPTKEFQIGYWKRGSGENTYYFGIGGGTNILVNTATPTSQGFLLGSRTSSTSAKLYQNSTTLGTSTTLTTDGLSSTVAYLGARNGNGIIEQYHNLNHQFTSIGDGLTDTEAANFYTAVQTFQTTLGRQVGVPIVADTDAQAFLNAAVITDSTQANAINTLVTSLKSANIWTKMKAIYPFVGGTATTHKFNLKDPRDLDAAYRLTFGGGWTHDSGGAQPNGTNGFANTYLIPSSVFNTTTFNHLSYYSRTNDNPSNFPYEIGSYGVGVNALRVRRTGNAGVYVSDYPTNTSYREASSTAITSGLGLFVGSQTGSNIKMYRNTTVTALNTTTSSSNSQSTYPLYLGTINGSDVLTANRWSAKKCGFASIGDGLSDSEVTAFYNAVQAYQTALGRQV